MNAIQNRQLAELAYSSPESLLEGIDRSILMGVLQNLESAKHLRGEQRKKILEKYHAGSLALLLKHILAEQMGDGFHVNITVYAETEFEDCDCVVKAFVTGKATDYKPVQLKQLPSHEINNKSELQATIDGLQNKYRDSIVSIWINRNIDVDLSQLRFDHLIAEQIWLFGDPQGEITLHGGYISDLKEGICRVAKMRDGIIRIGTVSLK